MAKKRKRQKPKFKSKWLYSFEVKKLVEEEVTETSENEKGEKVSITKTVESIAPQKIRIKRPTRRMYDDAELFYGIKLSEGIKAGLLTKALLAKRYEDDGGSMSEREKQEYFEVYYALLDKENEYQRIQLNLDNLDPDEKEDKLIEVLYDVLDLRKQLRDIEEAQASLFNQTAENRARNQVLMWWVLQLGYIAEDPIFMGTDYEEKVDKYDNLEEMEDPFWDEVIKKLAYFISFWYSGQANEKEDFDRALEIYVESNDDEEVGEEGLKETDMTPEEYKAFNEEVKELKEELPTGEEKDAEEPVMPDNLKEVYEEAKEKAMKERAEQVAEKSAKKKEEREEAKKAVEEKPEEEEPEKEVPKSNAPKKKRRRKKPNSDNEGE